MKHSHNNCCPSCTYPFNRTLASENSFHRFPRTSFRGCTALHKGMYPRVSFVDLSPSCAAEALMLLTSLSLFLTFPHRQLQSTLPGKASCQMVDYQVIDDREVVCSGEQQAKARSASRMYGEIRAIQSLTSLGKVRQLDEPPAPCQNRFRDRLQVGHLRAFFFGHWSSSSSNPSSSFSSTIPIR